MPTLTELMEKETKAQEAKQARMTREQVAAKREDRVEDKRRNRVPIGGHRDILTVDGKEPGFVYRFIMNYPDRIARFKRAGWEVVTHQVTVGSARAGDPTAVGSPVEAEAGGGAKLLLMRIEEEFYKEDQDAKEAEIRALEESMGKDVEGGYGSIKIYRDK